VVHHALCLPLEETSIQTALAPNQLVVLALLRDLTCT
jgi:hypothetical protein